MRTTIMAVIAALAFTVVARADDFNTFTVTGIVTGGFGGGSVVTNDDAGLFGGGDLLNAAVSVTVSYDATYVQNNYSYTYDSVGISTVQLGGNIGDTIPSSNSYQMSVTVGGNSYGVAGTFFDGMQLCSASDSDCGVNTGVVGAENISGNMIILFFSNSGSPFTVFDVNNPSDVSAAFTDPSNTFIVDIMNGPAEPNAYDSLELSSSSDQTTPEPSTWLLLFTGLGGMATLMLRRGTISRQRLNG